MKNKMKRVTKQITVLKIMQSRENCISSKIRQKNNNKNKAFNLTMLIKV